MDRSWQELMSLGDFHHQTCWKWSHHTDTISDSIINISPDTSPAVESPKLLSQILSVIQKSLLLFVAAKEVSKKDNCSEQQLSNFIINNSHNSSSSICDSSNSCNSKRETIVAVA